MDQKEPLSTLDPPASPGLGPNNGFDLHTLIDRDTILEVRTSKMKPMGQGLTIKSGIDKLIREERVSVGVLGLNADEHDPTFHGGRDKAVHGYCCSHYPSWQSEYPEAASRFVPGGFGENLCLPRLNERNICIGDIWAVVRQDGDSPSGDEEGLETPSGSPKAYIDAPACESEGGSRSRKSSDEKLRLQVSLPRQPCFKLNHRFRLRNFAPRTYELSRTGWYYRVLQTGSVQAGDELHLVSRPHPQWTIERVQEFLHRDKENDEASAALAEIEELGQECRAMFKSRVTKKIAQEKKKARARDGGQDEWKEYRVVEKKRETDRVASFILELVDASSQEDVAIPYGSHIQLLLPNKLQRSYSITHGSRRRFGLGIALDANSRGGSAYLHHSVQAGDVLLASPDRIVKTMGPTSGVSAFVVIAGGVGITAFLGFLEKCKKVHLDAALHYAVQHASDIPFAKRLEELRWEDEGKTESSSVKVIIYDASLGKEAWLDIPKVLKERPWNCRIDVCGPDRMMEAVREAARAQEIDEGDIHYEAFTAGALIGGDPFDVDVVFAKDRDADQGGETEGKEEMLHVHVGSDESLLEVLNKRLERENREKVSSSCEVGNCGTCRIKVKKGRLEHRGTALTEDEKEKGEDLLCCVSRGVGRIMVGI